MKANRKFVHDDEAVSPVIAVILMVAITVVLAATVFVLVNNLSENVTETAPVLSIANDKNTASEWKMTVLSSSQALTVDEYQFLYTTANNTIVEVNPTAFGFYCHDHVGNAGDRTTISTGYTTLALCQADAAVTPTKPSYHLRLVDVDGDGRLSPTDTLQWLYDDNAADEDFDDNWPSGDYKLQIKHKNSGGIVRQIDRTV